MNREQILSKAMFTYVQNLKNIENTYNPNQRANVNPFSGVLICELCRRPVSMVTEHYKAPQKKKHLTCKRGKAWHLLCSYPSTPIYYDLAVEALKVAFKKVSAFKNLSPEFLPIHSLISK